mmetsp:Transcript_46713/g.78414  ORF Transcript_46713/g.78414 Transcript_46713/m.78414 type:complete len:298 (-) Transcript_46713:71-964(-)
MFFINHDSIPQLLSDGFNHPRKVEAGGRQIFPLRFKPIFLQCSNHLVFVMEVSSRGFRRTWKIAPNLLEQLIIPKLRCKRNDDSLVRNGGKVSDHLLHFFFGVMDKNINARHSVILAGHRLEIALVCGELGHVNPCSFGTGCGGLCHRPRDVRCAHDCTLFGQWHRQQSCSTAQVGNRLPCNRDRVGLEPPQNFVNSDLVAFTNILLDGVHVLRVTVDSAPPVEASVLRGVFEVFLNFDLVGIGRLHPQTGGHTGRGEWSGGGGGGHSIERAMKLAGSECHDTRTEKRDGRSQQALC